MFFASGKQMILIGGSRHLSAIIGGYRGLSALFGGSGPLSSLSEKENHRTQHVVVTPLGSADRGHTWMGAVLANWIRDLLHTYMLVTDIAKWSYRT